METIRLVYDGPSATRQLPGGIVFKRGEPFDGPAHLLEVPGFRKADAEKRPAKPAKGGD